MKVAEEFNPVSLLDRIKKAETTDELLSLDTEGSGYKFASDKTRRRWDKAIQSRLSQLSRPSEPEKDKKKRKKSKKGGK